MLAGESRGKEWLRAGELHSNLVTRALRRLQLQHRATAQHA
jgi:hypothetical protein